MALPPRTNKCQMACEYFIVFEEYKTFMRAEVYADDQMNKR